MPSIVRNDNFSRRQSHYIRVRVPLHMRSRRNLVQGRRTFILRNNRNRARPSTRRR